MLTENKELNNNKKERKKGKIYTFLVKLYYMYDIKDQPCKKRKNKKKK